MCHLTFKAIRFDEMSKFYLKLLNSGDFFVAFSEYMNCFCYMNVSIPNVYLLVCKSQCGEVRSIVDDKFWHWKCERWLHDWTSIHAIQNAKGYWQLAETQLRDLQLWKIRVCDLQKKVLCMYMICAWLSRTMESLLQWSEVCGVKKAPLPYPYLLQIFYLPVK